MNARRFDALTVVVTNGARRASRRSLLRGLAAIAVTGIAPGAAQAYDGGVAPVQPPPSGLACTSGADCAAGEICLNGACASRQAVGGPEPAEPAATSVAVGDQGATGTTTPETIPVTPPETEGGVGGLIQPGEPLPARIFAGNCGALGAEPAFQLIDIGSVEGIEADETPQGALSAIPAEFSTTVVNATLADLLASEFAIDVRVDDTDPATSIACGDIGGPVEPGPTGSELAVGLQERGNSAYSGIAWLQDEGERTVVRVFLARGLEEGTVVTQAQPAAETAAEQPAEATSVEAAQPAATPSAQPLSPIAAGSVVITTIDVNLRAEPSDDAEILTILGQGVELEVTGAPADGWVPVIDPVSGQAGFVSDQFVTVAT